MADWIPQRAEELTPEWLDEVLREGGYLDEGRVVALDVEPMGEGLGFVGQVLRLRPTYEDAPAAAPVSLIAKLPGTVDKNRGAVEAGHGSEREIRFFRELAPDSALATPHCYLTLMDPDPKEAHRERDRESLERLPLWLIGLLVSLGTRLAGRSQRRYLLLIEDLAPRPVGDQIAGCELEPARRVARDLAGLHASFWDDPRLEEAQVWLPRLNGAPRLARAMYKKGRAQFLKEAGAFLPDGFMEAMDWVYENMEAVLDGVAARPFTLLHGDYRLDNLLFGEEEIFAVDWQSVARGRGVLDWSYFVLGSLHESCGEREEQSLLTDYHAALQSRGVVDYTFEECRRDYELCKLAIAYGNVAAAHLIDIDGERGEKLLKLIRHRLSRRLPPPPWDRLLS